MVPKGWKEAKLGEVIKHQKGYAFKSESYMNEGVRIIRISDTTRNSIHDKSPVYIDEEETVSLSQYKLDAEDIILSTVGSRPHLLDSMVGKAVKVPLESKGALLNQNLVKVVPKDNLITNNYLFSMITKSKFNYFISTLVRGNANQVSITLKELFAYTFPLPPLPEQQKIAKIISTWDKAISTTECLIDNSSQQKKALMQQLLTGKKRLLDESGQRFEGEWEERAVSSLGKIYSGGTPSTSNTEYWDGDINWITPTDITKQDSRYINSSLRKITLEGLENSSAKLVPAGSLLICTRATIGAMAITSHEMCTNQGFKNIVPNSKTNIVFVYYLLTYNKHRMISKASGSTFLELSKTSFESMRFRMPPLKEQQKIASVLTNADKEIELLEQQLADLQQEKKALMQVLLTGKKRVVV
jgi:type I restriction enzyme S subunit